MRYQPAHEAFDGRVPSVLRAPAPLRLALSAIFATVIGFVPAVFVATPALAAAGDVDFDYDIEAGEGDTFTFELRREGGTNLQALTLNYTTVDGTALGGLSTDTARDYTTISGTTTFPATTTNNRDVVKKFTVPVNDDVLDENNENFFLQFTGTVGGSPVTITAEATIDDNDAPPTYALSAADPIGEAAGTTALTATLSAVSGRNVVIPITNTPGTAANPADYTIGTPSITVLAGSLTGQTTITINEDALDEPDYETFSVSGGPGVTGSDTAANTGGPLGLRIQDNDGPPVLSVSDPGVVTEGNPLQFTVTLSTPSARTVTVQADTQDGTATEGLDYTAVVAQTVTFDPGDTSKIVSVPTLTDSLDEVSPETVKLNLSNSALATVAPGAATATGSITDLNSPPVVTLTPTPVVEGDNGTRSQTFTVHLDAPSGRPVTVGYHLSNGTATAGEDYVSAADGQVVFAPGSTSETFTVGIVGDTKDEADETFNITLSNSDGTATGAALGSNPITITDDDGAPALTTLPDVTMLEGNASGTATFHISLSNPSLVPITLDVTSTDDTAVVLGSGPGSHDFTLPSSTVVVPAGASGVDVPVTINGDTVYEGNEHATITVATQALDSSVTTSSQTANLTLTNDDAVPTVQLNVSSGAEGASIPVTATVTGVAQAAIPITLGATGFTNGSGSVAAQPADFTANLTATEIPAGATGTVSLGSVQLESDRINEVTQTVRVSLTSSVAGASATPAFIAITDDVNDMLPTITPGSTSVAENAGPAPLPVALDFTQGGNDATSTERDISAIYTTADGTARQPGDYQSQTGTVSFPAGTTLQTVAVPLVNDNTYEATEAFAVNLTSPTPALTPIAATAGAVTITDDDGAQKPTFTLSAPTNPVRENAGTATFTLQLSSVTQQDVDFTVTTADGTAKSGFSTPGNDDYVPITSTVRIAAGQDAATIPVTVRNDLVYEHTETADVTVALAAMETDATGSAQTRQLTITDDDAMPTVTLSSAAAPEGTNLTVYGTVAGVAQDDLPVTLTAVGAVNGSSVAADAADFDASALGSTVIPGGNHASAVPLGTVEFLNDTIDEYDQTVRVSLTGLAATPAPAWETITDDVNDLTPGVSVGVATVAESTTPVHVPLALDFSLSGNQAISTEKSVTVRYATTDGSAKATKDFTAPASGATATLPAGSLTGSIDIPVLNDSVYEHDESFTVTISSPAPSDVAIVTGSALVGITDDDGVSKPTFTVGNRTVNESAGTATYTVQLSAVSQEDVDFTVAAADGTATHGVSGAGRDDFVSPVSTVTVPAGLDTATFTVAINNDSVYEATESATITVGLALTEQDASGADVPATLTITDNDTLPTAVLSSTTAPEGTNVIVTGTVTGVAQEDLPVTLAAQGGSNAGSVAATGADFDASLGATVIPGGVHAGPVPLGTILFQNDQIDEYDQTLRVTMTGLTGTAPVFDTITDDVNDLTPTVAVGPQTVAENAGPAGVPVTLGFSQPGNDATSTEKTVAVNYATTGGTAVAGGDYTAAPGGASVSITPGQSSATISIPIVNDSIYEATESFGVTISSPTPAGVVITDASSAVTITDDDSSRRPTFSVANLPVTEGTGDGSAHFTVQLSATTTQPVTFDVAMQDGTATTGADYAGGDDYVPPVMTTVTVAAGQSSVTVPFVVNDDTVYEGPEAATLVVGLSSGEINAVGAAKTATLTITDDDAVPTIALTPQTGAEGSDLSIAATVTGSAQQDLVFDLSVTGDESNGNVAAGSSDYTLNDVTGTIPGGTESGSSVSLGSVSLDDDTLDELTEAFRVTAADPSHLVTTASVVDRILDDPADLPPTVSIGDVSIGEAEQSVDLTVSLTFGGETTATTKTITVPWNTVDGTARAGLDYTQRSGTLVFPAGTTSRTINVPILSDTLYENDQHFTVHLGTPAPAGVPLGQRDADVTILDDDSASAPVLQAPASRVGAGPVTLTGSSSEGAQVQLFAASPATPTVFTQVATTVASTTGAYSFTRTLGTGMIFYTRANSLTSARQLVSVVQAPTLVGTSTTKGAVALTVTGNPATAGQSVAIQRYLGNNQWSPVAPAAMTNAQGKYSATNTGLKSGSIYTFRAIFGNTSGQGILGGTSASIKVTVK